MHRSRVVDHAHQHVVVGLLLTGAPLGAVAGDHHDDREILALLVVVQSPRLLDQRILVDTMLQEYLVDVFAYFSCLSVVLHCFSF